MLSDYSDKKPLEISKVSALIDKATRKDEDDRSNFAGGNSHRTWPRRSTPISSSEHDAPASSCATILFLT
jgi:hypothetical protein